MSTAPARTGALPRRSAVVALAATLLTAALACEAAAATATAVAAGDDRTCAITTTSGVRCWGDVATGDGTSEVRRIPVDVGSVAGIVAALDVGTDHACVVTTSGGVVCWGENFHGQVGDGSAGPVVLAPTGVVGIASGASAVAAGFQHTCARMASGGVKCWGENNFGQLGDGTTDDSPVPVDVIGLGAPVASVVARGSRTCAVTTAGGVKCWGLNSGPVPVDVPGLTSGVAAIVLGSGHTCVLTDAGGVECFGSNDLGQLGDGTNNPSATPVDVQGLTSGVVAIDTLAQHTCALTAAGAMQCWGRNDRGQLGEGTTFFRTAPFDVDGLGSGVAAIATGSDHSCAVKTDGAVQCWGNGFHGATGTGWGYAFETLPLNVVDFGPPVCAIVDPGQVFASKPAPRITVKQGRNEFPVDDLTASGEFALPPGVSFADLDPESEGVRLQIRNQLGTVRADVLLRGETYHPVTKRGWKRNPTGSSWTYLANGNVDPFGVRRLQVSDRSRGAAGGNVRFTVRARGGLFPVEDDNDPVELTLILGDDASAAAGKCGKSAFVAGSCTENEPGTVLRCK